MSQDLYSVEQVADLLNLHVRTVRGYVREGRLKAVRIGKQYRIAREDLEAITGRPSSGMDGNPVARQRYVEASSIVEIDAVSPETFRRISNPISAASGAASRDDGARHSQPLRVETIYNEARGHLKIIIVGGLRASAGILELIHAVLES